MNKDNSFVCIDKRKVGKLPIYLLHIRSKSITFVQKIIIYGIHQRISQAMDGTYVPISGLLEQAACIVRRSKIAAGTLEPAESLREDKLKRFFYLNFVF